MVVNSIGMEFQWNIERMTLGGILRHLRNTNFENIIFSEFNLTRYLNHDLRIIKEVDNISRLHLKLFYLRKPNAYSKCFH